MQDFHVHVSVLYSYKNNLPNVILLGSCINFAIWLVQATSQGNFEWSGSLSHHPNINLILGLVACMIGTGIGIDCCTYVNVKSKHYGMTIL